MDELGGSKNSASHRAIILSAGLPFPLSAAGYQMPMLAFAVFNFVSTPSGNPYLR
jgi:hypothetical protein